MANGQQIAAENVRKFTVWMAAKTDADFRSMVIRGVLSRKVISEECRFATSVLTQNPTVCKELAKLETALRERGLLPPVASSAKQEPGALPLRQPDPLRHARDAERLSRLEQENAALKAENSELKRLLSRYTVLQEVLAETGRLPR